MAAFIPRRDPHLNANNIDLGAGIAEAIIGALGTAVIGYNAANSGTDVDPLHFSPPTKQEKRKSLRHAPYNREAKRLKKDNNMNERREPPPRDPRSGRTRTENETDWEGDTAMESARSSGRAPGGANNKDTPVTYVDNPTYGISNTHTTILPYRAWLTMIPEQQPSGGGGTYHLPAELELRLTSLNDIIKSTIAARPASGAALALPNVINDKLSGGSTYAAGAITYGGYATSFPRLATNGTGEQAQWANYFTKFYEWYQVLGVEYTITFTNLQGAKVDCIVGFGYDSSGASGTSNKFPSQPSLADAFAWKDIDFMNVFGDSSSRPGKQVNTLKGQYKAGLAKRNVQNDNDIKAWTAIASTPTLTETLRLFVWPAPTAAPATATNVFALNVEIDMKFIVQFKDLNTSLNYPTGAATFTYPTFPTDVLYKP